MFKRFMFFLLSFVLPVLIFGQSSELTVQGTSPDLYVMHTVAPKENWYSVGRLFNISPKDIAPVNGKTITTPLNIGEQLKVPLNANNFSQNNSKASDEVFVPVYHVVQEKEWMFRISANYNKVPVEMLEKWNSLGKDDVKAGAKLIIGYLKVKKDQSALASGNAVTLPVTQPAVSNPVATAPVSAAPAPETKKPETVLKQEPKTEPKATLPPVVETVQQVSLPAGDSYFKSLYEPAGKSADGVAGVFKSISGWQDKKFYALMNNVNVGTIIRVTNPGTNKSLYAKVLGQLPEMKESTGLAVRISDAAASELGVTVPKFPVQIAY